MLAAPEAEVRKVVGEFIPAGHLLDDEPRGYDPSKGTIVHTANPFQPHKFRRQYQVDEEDDYTIQSFLDQYEITFDLPTICIRNGLPLMREEWEYMPILKGDLIVFTSYPAGDDSNPLAVIAMIAVMAFAYWAGPQIAASAFGKGLIAAGLSAEMVTAVSTAVIGFVGSALVNALLPPPVPTSNLANQSLAAPSPTYNLAAQGNMARLGQAIPVQYGYHIIFPDFGATPYTEYAGNEQFLYQLFILGQGLLDIHSIHLEDTPITNFEDVQYEIVPPGGQVTLFPANVLTSSEVSNQEIISGSTLGPFVAVPPGKAANALAIDVVAPKGLYEVNQFIGGIMGRSVTFKAELQQLDTAGNPVGNWATLVETTLTGASTTPIRASFRADGLAVARYQVRVTRSTPNANNTMVGDELLWVGLRAYIPGQQAYGSVTCMAVRMRATNQLSNLSARKFNIIATRKLKAWSKAGGWTAEASTKSIAWACADICKNADYGLGLTDSRIDLEALEYLNSVWVARGDEFNGIFDSAVGAWEALRTVARSGRAYPLRHAGVITFVRDEAQTVPVGMFGSRNIAKGSFSLQYLTPTADMADAVEVEYFAKDKWVWDRVTAKLEGSTAEKPIRLPQLIGINTKEQAWREGMFVAATNTYRRKIGTFRTEMEGQIVLPGNLILVSLDMLSKSMSGEVTSYVGRSSSGGLAPNATVTLSNEVQFGAGDHYIGFRVYDGTTKGPYRVLPGADASTVVLPLGAPDFCPQVDLTLGERTYFAFGTLTSYVHPYKVINCRPQQQQVEIVCVIEDNRVHTADGGTVPPTLPPGVDLPPAPSGPVITPGSLFITQAGSLEAPIAVLSWQPATGALYYIVEHSVDGLAWTSAGAPTNPGAEVSVTPGLHYFRVAAVGALQGPWIQGSILISGNPQVDVPPPGFTNLQAFASINSIFLTWDDPQYEPGATIEIWRGNTNVFANATLLKTEIYPSYMFVDELGAQGITKYYWARLVNKFGTPGPFAGPVGTITGGADFTVGTSGNSVWNPEFYVDMKYWRSSIDTWPAGYVNFYAGRNLDSNWALQGAGTGYIVQTGYENMGLWFYPAQSSAHADMFDACTAGEYIEASAYTGVHRCVATMGINWYNSSYGYITTTWGAGTAGSNNQEAAGGRTLAEYKRIFVIGQAPPGAAFFMPAVYKGPTLAQQVNSYLFVTKMFVGRARPEQTTPSPYSNGSGGVPTTWLAGQITETQITDGAIKAPKIAANQIVASHIAANTIGANHIIARNITGGHLATNNLITAEAQINNAMINTLHVQGDAITVPTAVYAGDTLNIAPVWATWNGTVLLQTPWKVYSGQPVFIHFSVRFSGSTGNSSFNVCRVHILRDGFSIWSALAPVSKEVLSVSSVMQITYTWILDTMFSMNYVDYCPAGQHMYYLYTETNIYNATVNTRSMLTLEVKR